eukprot:3514942-Alexandrium_andersonii.AAC.1
MELQEWASLPALICGDLNAPTANIAPVQTEIDSSRYFDLGARVSIWEANAVTEPTALAHGAKSPSRIDYAFANQHLFHQVKSFRLAPWGVFDVHRA